MYAVGCGDVKGYGLLNTEIDSGAYCDDGVPHRSSDANEKEGTLDAMVCGTETLLILGGFVEHDQSEIHNQVSHLRMPFTIRTL